MRRCSAMSPPRCFPFRRAGLLPSIILTAGLRLLRFPVIWNLAAIMRAAGVVAVGLRE